MLHQFLIALLLFCIFLFGVFLFKVAIPMWKFMDAAESAIVLYAFFRRLLVSDIKPKNEIRVSYGKYEIKFSNLEEARQNYEKLVKRALELYDQLEIITILDEDSELQDLKNKLNKICFELRRLNFNRSSEI